jgi:hypothetical protein
VSRPWPTIVVQPSRRMRRPITRPGTTLPPMDSKATITRGALTSRVAPRRGSLGRMPFRRPSATKSAKSREESSVTSPRALMTTQPGQSFPAATMVKARGFASSSRACAGRRCNRKTRTIAAAATAQDRKLPLIYGVQEPPNDRRMMPPGSESVDIHPPAAAIIPRTPPTRQHFRPGHHRHALEFRQGNDILRSIRRRYAITCFAGGGCKIRTRLRKRTNSRERPRLRGMGDLAHQRRHSSRISCACSRQYSSCAAMRPSIP